jgi:putative spermidine/putrescine transport system permease protein
MMRGLLRDRRVQLLVLLAPGVGYLLVFFGSPLLSALIGSFRLEDGSFTLSLYERIFTGPSMIRGLTTSIYYGVMPVIVSLAVSVPLALLIRKSFFGRKLFSGLYKLPMAVPGIIVGLMVIVVFERGGFMDRLFAPLGITLPKLVRDDWGIGVIIAGVWKQIPNAKISVMMSERYSSTFGRRAMVASPGCPICCRETENWISSGIARKNTTRAPRTKNTGVATR